MFVLKRSPRQCVQPISLFLMGQQPAGPKQMCSCTKNAASVPSGYPNLKLQTFELCSCRISVWKQQQQQRQPYNNNKTKCETPPKKPQNTPGKQMGNHAIVDIIYKIAAKKQSKRPSKLQHCINRNKQRQASVLRGGGGNLIALSLTLSVTPCTYQECILLSNIYHFWWSQVFLLQKDFNECP